MKCGSEMKNNYIKLVLIICVSLCITSCWSEFGSLKESFRNRNIPLYKIHSIGLMPMIMDDTTDSGTFYSTNYFLKSLKQEFPKYKINVVDVGGFVESDSLFIKKVVQKIRSDQKLSKETLLYTGLDSVFQKDSLDAVIIGTINKINHQKYYQVENHVLINCKMTKCDFTYYLISLNDGKILWRAQTTGKSVYANIPDYPPLDVAISSGIDEFFDSIPL